MVEKKASKKSIMAMNKDKITGSLIGLAVGDALGVPYEFRTPPLIFVAVFSNSKTVPNRVEFLNMLQKEQVMRIFHKR